MAGRLVQWLAGWLVGWLLPPSIIATLHLKPNRVIKHKCFFWLIDWYGFKAASLCMSVWWSRNSSRNKTLQSSYRGARIEVEIKSLKASLYHSSLIGRCYKYKHFCNICREWLKILVVVGGKEAAISRSLKKSQDMRRRRLYQNVWTCGYKNSTAASEAVKYLQMSLSCEANPKWNQARPSQVNKASGNHRRQ